MAARSRPTAWITLDELASALDMSRSGAHRLLKRVPPRFVRRDGRRLRIYGPAALAVRVEPRMRRLLERQRRDAVRAALAAQADVDLVLLLGLDLGQVSGVLASGGPSGNAVSEFRT